MSLGTIANILAAFVMSTQPHHTSAQWTHEFHDEFASGILNSEWYCRNEIPNTYAMSDCWDREGDLSIPRVNITDTQFAILTNCYGFDYTLSQDEMHACVSWTEADMASPVELTNDQWMDGVNNVIYLWDPRNPEDK